MNIKVEQKEQHNCVAPNSDQTKGMFMSDDSMPTPSRKKLYRLLVEVDEADEEAFDALLDSSVAEEMTVDDYERYVEEQNYLANLSGWAVAPRLPIVPLEALATQLKK